MRRYIARALVVLSLVGLVPAVASAGPQLLCFPMVIGDARSLPWGGGGWNSPEPTYDVTRLSTDTVSLLTPDVPVLVRMETLRRAVIYAARDGAASERLFAALRAHVPTSGRGKDAALARFDLGYAVEAFRQTRHAFPRASAMELPEDGYALIRESLAARGADAATEYAAALVAASRTFGGVSDEHLGRALAGAPDGSDLARTIAAHRPIWGERLTAAARTASR